MPSILQMNHLKPTDKTANFIWTKMTQLLLLLHGLLHCKNTGKTNKQNCQHHVDQYDITTTCKMCFLCMQPYRKLVCCLVFSFVRYCKNIATTMKMENFLLGSVSFAGKTPYKQDEKHLLRRQWWNTFFNSKMLMLLYFQNKIYCTFKFN